MTFVFGKAVVSLKEQKIQATLFFYPSNYHIMKKIYHLSVLLIVLNSCTNTDTNKPQKIKAQLNKKPVKHYVYVELEIEQKRFIFKKRFDEWTQEYKSFLNKTTIDTLHLYSDIKEFLTLTEDYKYMFMDEVEKEWEEENKEQEHIESQYNSINSSGVTRHTYNKVISRRCKTFTSYKEASLDHRYDIKGN